MPATPVIAVALSAAILIGFLSTLLGALRPALAARFGVSEDQAPRLDRWLSLAWAPLMPLTGWMIDAWGVHSILFAGSLFVAVGVVWLGVCQSMRALGGSIVALGWGGAAVTLAGIRLMPEVVVLGRWPTNEGSLCVGFVFVAVAALLTQWLYPVFLRRAGYRNTLLLSALLCLTPAAICSFLEPAALPGPLAEPAPGAAVADPRLWLLVLLIFFWFPIEHSLDVWPRPFLSELGYTGRAVGAIVGFWFWFLATRLAMGWLFSQGFEIWLVYVLALIPPMVLGNLVGAYAPSSGYFGFWVIGGCYGPLLPAFLGMTFSFFDKRCFFLGIMLSIDSLCALLVQPAYVRYIRGHTARQAMRIPLIFGLLFSGVILVLALVPR